jgi:hypothetical protein
MSGTQGVTEIIPEADLITFPEPPGGGKDAKLPLGAYCWALFEGARNPYVILITIYIFMPYVASVVVGNPIKGQELISRWSTYSSLAIMVTAPFLGASIDKLGRRKTWLALIVVLMDLMIFTLWWTKPDGSGLSLTGTLIITSLIGILFPYTEVLHNSLLVRAAGLNQAHKASGLALALGNGFSVVALGFTAWAFALPGSPGTELGCRTRRCLAWTRSCMSRSGWWPCWPAASSPSARSRCSCSPPTPLAPACRWSGRSGRARRSFGAWCAR